ncbi:MAG TPA: hypothetical protein VFP11_02675, partial [Candidatus Angelobacter sp.]|nr:hypothetical protein [Candidatus Angelobacter sp.]
TNVTLGRAHQTSSLSCSRCDGEGLALDWSPHWRVSSVCSKFSAENPQVLHIPEQRFSTKDQNEKIRMAAAEQQREVATAEPLLAGFAVSCMK